MNQVKNIIGNLDFYRSSCLRLALKIHFIRNVYTNCSTRLSIGYLLTLLFYFPISLLRPDILLLSGPLIFGYPHLIASFRYVLKMNAGLFAILTLICIFGHVSGIGSTIFNEWPFGTWQILLAMAGLVFINYKSKSFSPFLILLSLLLSCGILYLAFQDAIIFVGGMLILHNWVGYFYWIMASKTKSRRITSVAALMIFTFIHILVLNGHMDFFFSGATTQINFPGDTQATAWYLASWSSDSIVWYRFLVLYAFGLSMHYFVWLKAIPQSLNPLEHPNNIRLSIKYLREDIGDKILLAFVMISILGIMIWLFSFNLGSRVYFEMAILHGALELIFFIPRILVSFKNIIFRSKLISNNSNIQLAITQN